MKFNDMTKQEQMDWATRDILILSIAYYELNYNLVSDKSYDARLKWLCNFASKYPEIAEKSYYAKVLKDIDPSTGFDLYYKLDTEHQVYLKNITSHIIKLNKAEKGGRKQ